MNILNLVRNRVEETLNLECVSEFSNKKEGVNKNVVKVHVKNRGDGCGRTYILNRFQKKVSVQKPSVRNSFGGRGRCVKPVNEFSHGFDKRIALELLNSLESINA